MIIIIIGGSSSDSSTSSSSSSNSCCSSIRSSGEVERIVVGVAVAVLTGVMWSSMIIKTALKKRNKWKAVLQSEARRWPESESFKVLIVTCGGADAPLLRQVSLLQRDYVFAFSFYFFFAVRINRVVDRVVLCLFKKCWLFLFYICFDNK